ncbi:hypothetical protein BGZ83_008056, partial [Gryganskiella cystojenkinii]
FKSIMMNTLVNPNHPTAATASVGPLDQVPITATAVGATPSIPVPQQKRGSLTPGGSFSKSELSSMAGSIASKLDQYLETTTRQDRGSNDSTASLTGGTPSSLEDDSVIGLTLRNHKSSSSVSSVNNGSIVDEDTALANNLAAISLAAQKISDIYLEPKPKKSAPDGFQVTTDHFEPEKHFYPRVLNAQIHPMVGYFFSLGNERIIARYMHLNPQVDELTLRKCLEYVPKHFQWAGKL